MALRIVNQAGIRALLTSTFAVTGQTGDDKRLVHLHAENGELMPGHANPVLGPIAPEDVDRLSEEWAVENGWSRLPDGS